MGAASACLAAVILAGCGLTPKPRVTGASPVALSAALIDEVHVFAIHVEAAPQVLLLHAEERGIDARGWDVVAADNRMRSVKSELEDDVSFELRQELNRCASGGRRVDAVVRLDHVAYGGRALSSSQDRNLDVLTGVAELIDPADQSVLARYPIEVGTYSGGLARRVFSDRLDTLAEEFGRALCVEAFGRNPRPHRVQNSTLG